MKNKPNKEETPPGWKTIQLRELVTESQAAKIWEILNEHTDSTQCVRALTTYLNTMREDLMKKEMLPEFLAYALVYKHQYERGSEAVNKTE